MIFAVAMIVRDHEYSVLVAWAVQDATATGAREKARAHALEKYGDPEPLILLHEVEMTAEIAGILYSVI